jgi:hypothetical protein
VGRLRLLTCSNLWPQTLPVGSAAYKQTGIIVLQITISKNENLHIAGRWRHPSSIYIL